jgi:6-phosphogluconolactonase (cycloisomerase 2 family)
MEINQRMSKRFAWLLGVVGLVLVGLLVACGTKYNSSSNGLILVGSQGSAVLETFSFDLSSGHVSTISNPTTTSGQPSSVVLDPAGSYAYVLVNQNSIATFKVNSDGTTTAIGSPASFNQGTVTNATTMTIEKVSVIPNTIVMDPAGKFLFVADRATTDSAELSVPGSVSVFAIGSSGALTEVAGSPFFTSNPAITIPQSGIDIVAVAPTPTVFPAIGINGVQNSVCSTPGLNPPTSQYLYAVDGVGGQVFEFQVDTSSGVLTAPTGLTAVPSFPTDAIPAGVAVDPCDRFVYVSGNKNARVNAYTICSSASPVCPVADGGLVPVSGSPFSLSGSASGPGPLVVDPYGNYVYVLDTLSNAISPLKISPISGSLTALNPATVATGGGPTSIAIRGDDNWLFVTNHGTGGLGGTTVSQYAITPASGALTAQPAITTDNYPWGVAVK